MQFGNGGRPMSAHMGWLGRNRWHEGRDRLATEGIDLGKLKPKKVWEEREHLYEEALKLKIQTNGYKDQNKLLKT